MTNEYTEKFEELRDRAYRIHEAAKQDDDVPDWRVDEIETGLELIEMGWETVRNHPDPQAAAPFDLDAKIDQWDREFSEQERMLGIA